MKLFCLSLWFTGFITGVVCFSKFNYDPFDICDLPISFLSNQLVILIVESLETALEPTFALAMLVGLVKLVTLQLVVIFSTSMKLVGLMIFLLEMEISAIITFSCFKAFRNLRILMVRCQCSLQLGNAQ